MKDESFVDAIGITDPDWHRQLGSRQPPPDIVNFWTPTPWKLQRLQPGAKWYFMLKSPIRKIGGFGIVDSLETLKLTDAWSRFGKANGVDSLEELRDRTRRYVERRTQRPLGDDYEIGCVVLRESSFWKETEYRDPAELLGVPVPNQVVTYKYVAGAGGTRGLAGGSSKAFSFQPGLPTQSTDAGRRRAVGAGEVDRIHARIQKALYASLVAEHGPQNVAAEQLTTSGRPADLMVRLGGGYAVYEIKTAPTARDCVREALGQLLEYGYWAGSPTVLELWVVGPTVQDAAAEAFLETLRTKFTLPIRYRHQSE